MSRIRFTLEDGRAVMCGIEPLGTREFDDYVKSLMAQLEEGTLTLAHSSGDYLVIDVEVVEGEVVPC